MKNWLRELIECCVLAADRPKVRLPEPAEEVEPTAAVVYVEPRCPTCKVRSVMKTYFAHYDRWGTCGDVECHRESIKQKARQWPLGLQIKPPPKRGSRR